MKIAWTFYLQELKKSLSYRAEFWLNLVGSVGSYFGVAFFLWKSIFLARGAETLQGYTFPALMLYSLLIPLVERSVMAPDMIGISGEIYDGGLSRYLLYPVSYFRVKFSGTLAQATIYMGQMGLVLAIYAAVFGRADISPLSLLMGLIAILFSGCLGFWMLANLEMVAFWADNVWSLAVMNRMASWLMGGGMVPLAFFPDRVRSALEWLPYIRLLSFPVRCLLGQVGWAEWLFGLGMTAAWSLVFALSGALLWRKGLRVYAGVGI